MKLRPPRSVAGLILLTVTWLAGPAPGGDGTGQTSLWDRQALARFQSPPTGLPATHSLEQQPAVAARIALGRKLFFDRRLSVNNTMSCAMCHIPEQGFTNNELATPVGVAGQSLRRNAPTILNSAYLSQLFLDGRAASLEKQAIAPLLAKDEMANPSPGKLLEKIQRLSDYEGLFEQAFGSGPSMEFIGNAIASWERTLLAADSPFDRWRYGGQQEALTRQQREGFELFIGKARCAKCHTVSDGYALFTDQSFHNTGIGYLRDVLDKQRNAPVSVEVAPQRFVLVERETIGQVGHSRAPDLGRFEITHDPADKWRFRTPSLRNVAVTGPYMHDGSLPNLEAIVRFYNRGGTSHPGLDPLIMPLGLDDSEIAALVMFLRSLTASNLATLEADARSAAVGN